MFVQPPAQIHRYQVLVADDGPPELEDGQRPDAVAAFLVHQRAPEVQFMVIYTSGSDTPGLSLQVWWYDPEMKTWWKDRDTAESVTFDAAGNHGFSVKARATACWVQVTAIDTVMSEDEEPVPTTATKVQIWAKNVFQSYV